MRNGIKVVDADCHQMEPEDMWAKYIDPKYKDDAPQYIDFGGNRVIAIEGNFVANEGKGEDGTKYAYSTEEFTKAVHDAMQSKHSELMKTGFSAQQRLADLDAHGVDVQLMHPTDMGFLMGRNYKDLGLLVAVCRAYNDWSADYCSVAPERLRFSAVLPLHDPKAAVYEAKRVNDVATDFYVRPNPICNRNLYHDDYLPLWELLEELGKPISIHDVASCMIPSFGDRMDSHTTGHILSHPFEAMAAMVGMIWWGIFERFPGFKAIHVEADAGWVPYWLQRQEQHYEFSGNAEHPNLKMRPTEYFKRNIFVAARGDEPTLPAIVELVGDDNLLFNTDYPHPDGTFPSGLEALERQPVPEESRRKIYWDNARRAFNLPDRPDPSAIPAEPADTSGSGPRPGLPPDPTKQRLTD
jgi:predicted TIM-barrel fold metal-dependent hydrolase